ncbi:hypothetical protein, partial [Trichormus variabilis]|uniref:hypothetical protein n=1 Tax=Anabaena variabilis TaxID=264691 RepID=UPI001A7EE0CA
MELWKLFAFAPDHKSVVHLITTHGRKGIGGNTLGVKENYLFGELQKINYPISPHQNDFFSPCKISPLLP